MSTATAPPRAAQSPAAPANAPPARSRLRDYLASSVGGKQLVAVTGLGLTGFVLVHMLGNLQIFAGLGDAMAGQDALNGYAKFLKDQGPLLWVARGALLLIFVLHIALALWLNARNRAARPVAYHYRNTIKATWASRHMVSTGVVVGLFVLFHLAHYTFGWVDGAEVQPVETPSATRTALTPA